MTFDKEEHQITPTFTHELQHRHKQYLDALKINFYKIYSNPFKYEKSVTDFDFLRILGNGAYGTVLLVRDKISFVYHAMKVIDKSEVVKKKNVKQLFNEKKILQSACFEFLLSLDYCCKDNVYLYFVLPYETGGELYTLIKKFGVLSEVLAQFYAAQIVMAIEYLHHCSVMHRDIKPENILINESGYVRLGDFGFCKVIKSRTWTLCGTPEYLAPELITSKGYSYAADWWSVGILVYEMNAGYPPFYSSDPIKLYEKILVGKYKNPEAMSSHCKSLVKSLLQVDPSKRFGALKAGVFDIKSHGWFLGLDWNLLLHQKLKPPFVPVSRSVGESTKHFADETDIKLQISQYCLYEDYFADF